MKEIRLGVAAMAAVLVSTLTSLPAQAQAWPERTVRVIIPFPPGGTLDKVGRMLAQRLGEQFGQTFVVENRPGGNGVIGGDAVAKAAPDGHTLLFNASTFVTAPLTMKSVPLQGADRFRAHQPGGSGAAVHCHQQQGRCGGPEGAGRGGQSAARTAELRGGLGGFGRASVHGAA